MRNAVIVSVARTPIGRAKKGSLKDTQPVEFAAPVLKALMERTPGLKPERVDDILLGCAMPEGEQGMNVSRIIALTAGFPDTVPTGMINRFCSSGSQSIAWMADSIKAGSIDVAIAGGVESMSYVPLGGNKMVADTEANDFNPHIYPAMGATAEIVA